MIKGFLKLLLGACMVLVGFMTVLDGDAFGWVLVVMGVLVAAVM